MSLAHVNPVATLDWKVTALGAESAGPLAPGATMLFVVSSRSRTTRVALVRAARCLSQRWRSALPVGHCDSLAEQHAAPQQEERVLFPGSLARYTPELKLYEPHIDSLPPSLPCFRILDDIGRIVPGAERHVLALDNDQALALMTTMLRMPVPTH